jgi:hypothetical protein
MDDEYRIVVFWRWDKGQQSADCFWCVRWPAMSDEVFEQERSVRLATFILMNGPDAKYRIDDDQLLKDMGYPEAGQMLRDIPKAELRARFNQMEMEVFTSDVPLTREQIEAVKLNRRES